MSELLSFQSYETAEEATSVAELLQGHGIEAEAFESPVSLGAVYVGESYINKFTVKIAAEDFTKAKEIMQMQAAILPAEIPADHPLHAMSDNELIDIISKQDEWGFENYNVALELLKARGTRFTPEELDKLAMKRIQTLSKRKSVNTAYLTTGFAIALLQIVNAVTVAGHFGIISLFYFSFLGGIAGICMGIAIYYPKIILPDGTSLPAYDDGSYRQGKFLFYLNLVTFCLNIAVIIVVYSLLPVIS